MFWLNSLYKKMMLSFKTSWFFKQVYIILFPDEQEAGFPYQVLHWLDRLVFFVLKLNKTW
jgi:hypothetical protein